MWSEVSCDLRRDTLTELTLAAVMGLNPNAPEWTPERNSSGERMKAAQTGRESLHMSWVRINLARKEWSRTE